MIPSSKICFILSLSSYILLSSSCSARSRHLKTDELELNVSEKSSPAKPAGDSEEAFELTSASKKYNDDKFQELKAEKWQEVFHDPGNEDWKERWFLDGKRAKVENDKEKMILETPKNGFAVLWTHDSFKGDLKIEYDFLRADSYKKGVNIIYIQATGKGKKGYDKDITKWSHKRKNAYMSDYFAFMKTYHISYATDGNDYIRGRRYTPNKGVIDSLKLWGTALDGGLKNAGIFGDKKWIHVTIIKRAKDLFVEFKHPTKTIYTHLRNTDKNSIKEGRVGLRLMKNRRSYFKNFKISQVKTKENEGN